MEEIIFKLQNFTSLDNSTFTSHTVSNYTKLCTIHGNDSLLIFLYSLVFIVGVVGNIIVIIIFTPSWRNGPIIELFILDLAISDLFSSFVNPIVFIYWIATCHDHWHFGWLGCKILPALARIFTDISTGIILCMAIDRCRAIVTPLKRRLNRHLSHVVVLLIVLVSISCELYYIIAINIHDGGCVVKTIQNPWYSYPLVTTTIFSVTFLL